jgi:hypothetical protein
MFELILKEFTDWRSQFVTTNFQITREEEKTQRRCLVIPAAQKLTFKNDTEGLKEKITCLIHLGSVVNGYDWIRNGYICFLDCDS